MPIAESDAQRSRERRAVYTVGHSNRAPEAFFGLLAAFGVEVLADVRSAPYSRYAPQFNREALHAEAERRGVRYVFLGEELGGRPREAALYDAEGHVLYGRVAATERFQAGIARLVKGAAEYRIALLYAEEDPAGCHRSLLVARVLRERDIAVRHIRADGRLEDDTEPGDVDQLRLWGEEAAWRSVRSVLPASRPPSSSGS